METVQKKVREKINRNQKSNLDLFISATSWLIGLSVGYTVNALVQQNVHTENKRQSVELVVGSAAISFVTKEIVKDKVEQTIYSWVDDIRDAKKEIEEEIASRQKER